MSKHNFEQSKKMCSNEEQKKIIKPSRKKSCTIVSIWSIDKNTADRIKNIGQS
jgi:hypothetical protein